MLTPLQVQHSYQHQKRPMSVLPAGAQVMAGAGELHLILTCTARATMGLTCSQPQSQQDAIATRAGAGQRALTLKP